LAEQVAHLWKFSNNLGGLQPCLESSSLCPCLNHPLLTFTCRETDRYPQMPPPAGHSSGDWHDRGRVALPIATHHGYPRSRAWPMSCWSWGPF